MIDLNRWFFCKNMTLANSLVGVDLYSQKLYFLTVICTLRIGISIFFDFSKKIAFYLFKI